MLNREVKRMEDTSNILKFCKTDKLEAGIDESGAGCLAGDVIAAAVIWPSEVEYFEQFPEFEEPGSIELDYTFNLIRTKGDSKKLTERQRNRWFIFTCPITTVFATLQSG